MEEQEKYYAANDDRIVSYNVKFTVTRENCIRVHEIIRELYRCGSLEKDEMESLLACCEYF